jgi:rRNA-processing protein EBP2
MLKTDGHMAKVKTRLLSEQKRMEAFEERRRAQSARKFSKAVHAEKNKAKAADKKSSLAAIETWKKTKASRGGAIVDEQSSKQLETMLSGSGHNIHAPSAKPKPAAASSSKYVAPRSNAKRRYKDSKFGFGGAKRHSKDGDRKSTSDVSKFSMKANRSLPGGFKGKSKPAARPGKRRREGTRN